MRGKQKHNHYGASFGLIFHHYRTLESDLFHQTSDVPYCIYFILYILLKCCLWIFGIPKSLPVFFHSLPFSSMITFSCLMLYWVKFGLFATQKERITWWTNVWEVRDVQNIIQYEKLLPSWKKCFLFFNCVLTFKRFWKFWIHIKRTQFLFVNFLSHLCK